MRLALYQPDIPPNLGTILRLAACMSLPVDIIEPCGFPLTDRGLRRAGMDYLERVTMSRHRSWDDYLATRAGAPGRLSLLTTRARRPYTAFRFEPDDTLLAGRESAGVPDEVHDAADARLRIPMAPGMRSLNVALGCAMVLGEALRQTGLFPQASERGETP